MILFTMIWIGSVKKMLAMSKYKIFISIALLISTLSIQAGKHVAKQESTHSRDWMSLWQMDGGYIAAKKNRSLWVFGGIKKEYFAFGQIIDKKPIYTYHLSPEKIRGKWKDLSVMWNRVYAIKSDGTLWGWGRDVIGSKYISKPIQIGSSKKWKTIETRGSSEGGECGDYTLAFQKDGSLWGWGDRRREFFEFIKNYSINKPNKISGNWDKITMGCYDIYATKKNGTLWKWGVDEKAPIAIVDKKEKKRLLKKMATVHAKISVFDIDLQSYYRKNRINGIRKNGTLWLKPIVTYR